MRTSFFFLLFSLFFTSASFSQQAMSEEDWQKIITPLSSSDWKNGEKISLEFLNRYKGEYENSIDASILRYMYIRCVGANLSEDKDKTTAINKVKKFIGKKIITPGIVYKEKGMFNFFKLSQDDPNKLGLCASNDTNTSIFTFEYFTFKDPNFLKNIKDFEGKEIRLQAEIKSIEANGFALPRLDIQFKNAEIFE